MRRPSDRHEPFAFVALFAGAVIVASSGVFVRLSETGPTATGFWRGVLALPFLALWARLERRPGDSWRTGLKDSRIFWAGAFFAGDLALWHWSLILTTVTASTLEANLSPIFVTLIAWVVWRERPTARFMVALAIAIFGVVLIVSPKLGEVRGALIGDALGLATAFFYGAYIVVIARLGTTYRTGALMLRTTAIFTLLLAPLMIGQKILPDTLHGWMLLVGLALVAQVVGQGLIAYALAYLPASFGSVVMLLQPLAVAVYAAWILDEHLTFTQLVGGAIVMAAIVLANRARR